MSGLTRQGDDFAIPHTVLRHFDLSSSPYTEAVVDDVKRARHSSPGNLLYFDKLAAFADLDGPALYPPTSPAALRRLLYAIHSSPPDRLKRDCFVYYLLRDHAEPAGASHDAGTSMRVDGAAAGSTSRATAFARARCMPAAWTVLMDGYWALDHGQWEAAVAALSDPRIPDLNFVSDILATLASDVSPPAAACRLIHTFLGVTPRPLLTDTDHDIRLIAIASAAGVPAAFAAIRALPDAAARAGARADVWSWALGAPRVPVGAGAHTAQAAALRQLLHLPLLPDEHAHLLAYLARPPRAVPPPALSLLHDLVALRLVHQGQYAETLELDRALAGRGSDDDRQRRRETVREFIDILPAVQKRVLRVDAAARAGDVPFAAAPAAAAANGDRDIDMASSWVEVDAEPAAPPATSAPPPFAMPTPVRPALLNDATPQSPARVASPFAGPPRFAPSAPPSLPAPSLAPSSAPSSPAPAPPTARLASPVRHAASPFAAPPKAAPVRRSKATLPKKLIVDDDEPLPAAPTRRTTRPSPDPLVSEAAVDDGAHGMPQENGPVAAPDVAADAHVQTPARRTKRVAAVPRETSLAPPTPAGTTPARRSRRQTTAPPSETTEDDMPPPPIPGSFITSPPAPPPSAARMTRARITRSASRALLDEGEDTAPKRAKSARRPEAPPSAASRPSARAVSEMTDDGASVASAATSARRSTRRGASVAASDAGSPTPSVAASVGGKSDAVRRQKEASATPRATRSRK